MGQFNIYKDGVKVSTTDDTIFDFTGLESDTEYVLGVSRVVDGRESEVVTVNATTKEYIPHSLHVTDRTDTSISLKWDSETSVGDGVYNVYVDDKLFEQGIKRREFKVRGLKPSTEYKFCLCGVKEDGSETQKVTVSETTLVEIPEDEPELTYPLVNLVSDGSFENYDGDGAPDGWNVMNDLNAVLGVDTDFKTHGEQSLKVLSTDGGNKAVSIIQKVIDFADGYYVTIVDYKLPDGEVVNGRERFEFVMLGANSKDYVQIRGGTGTNYVVGKMEDNHNNIINLYYVDYASDKGGGYISYDSLRSYRISEEMYKYLDKGKMTIDRLNELFPFVDSVDAMGANVDDYHTGAGWYELPNGEKVRGKDNAIAVLEDLMDK